MPHIVEEIKYEDGLSKKMSYPVLRAKITKETSEEITRMLVGLWITDSKRGLNILALLQNWHRAGCDSVNGGYYDRHTHSFMGYPAYNPKFIVFLYAINPKGVEYSATTGPVLCGYYQFLLNYYEVAPDR